MSYFLRQRWRQQPQGAVRIDWSNPLSRGLVRFYDFSQSSPTSPLDLVTMSSMSIASGSTGYSRQSTFNGVGARNSTMNSDYWMFSTRTETAQSISVFSVANINSYSNAYIRDNTSGGGNLPLNFSAAPTGTLAPRWGGTNYSGTGSFKLLGVVNAYLAISSSSGVRSYINGLNVLSSSTVAASPTITSPWYLGKNGPVNAGGVVGTHLVLAIWNRPLTESEAVSLSSQGGWWQLLKPQQSILISLPSGNLFSALDETVSDRNDYILSSSAGQVYQTTLSPVAQPGAGTNIDFNFDAESPEDSGSIKFDLLSGPTTVKSQTVSLVRNWAGRIRSPQLRQQPQGAVQVDWSHPIALGLVGAWTGSSPNVNLVRNTQLTGGSARIAPSKNGLEYSPPAGINGFQLLTSAQTPTGQACATLLYRKRDSTNRESLAFGTSLANAERFHAHLPYSDGTVYFDYGGSTGTNRVSAAGLTFGNDVWSFNNSPTGLQIWQNGILRASNNNAAQTRTSGTGLNIGGVGVSGYTDLASTAVFLVHNRALTAAEIASLAKNPWQIFRPPARTVCFPSPAQTSFSITPSDYSVISSWPWTPTLKVTSL